MSKYDLRKEKIKQDDGTEITYNVLTKERVRRKQGKDLNPDRYYNIVEPAEIWFTDAEKDDIMEALEKF